MTDAIVYQFNDCDSVEICFTAWNVNSSYGHGNFRFALDIIHKRAYALTNHPTQRKIAALREWQMQDVLCTKQNENNRKIARSRARALGHIAVTLNSYYKCVTDYKKKNGTILFADCCSVPMKKEAHIDYKVRITN